MPLSLGSKIKKEIACGREERPLPKENTFVNRLKWACEVDMKRELNL